MDKFISTLDAKKSKTDQTWADITSDSDNAEDELEILYTFALAFVKDEIKIKGKWKLTLHLINIAEINAQQS